MQWGRMVGWNEHLAGNDFAALQSGLPRCSDLVEVSTAGLGNFYLCIGNGISIIYLVEKNAIDLVNVHYWNASGDRIDDGLVSFRTHHDHS